MNRFARTPVLDASAFLVAPAAEIKADISELTEALTIGDLDLPDGVEPILDLEKHIAHIAYKAAEEAEGDAEAADVDADGSEPVVITEKKEEESGDEG